MKGVVIATVVETQLEMQLLPGLHKSDTVLDPGGHLAIKPDSVCHWTIHPELFHELFIPALSRWCIEDLTHHGSRIMNIFLKLLSMKRSLAFFDEEWHRKTALPPSGNSLQSLEMTDLHFYQEHLENLLVSRTIIATRNHLAIAPDITQPGDVICLLSGCDAPVILRPRTNGTYILIGDTFIESDQPGQDAMYEQIDDALLSRLEYITLV